MLLAYRCSVCSKKAPKDILESLLAAPSRTRLCVESDCKRHYMPHKQNLKIKIAIPSDFEDDLVIDSAAGAALGPDISDLAVSELPKLPNILTKKKTDSNEKDAE
ncbi:MAG: hypothetical protein ACFFB3_18090 [Candidatus Hodarchaeota archaeon]